MYNHKIIMYEDCEQHKLYSQIVPSKGEISYCYTDMYGNQVDIRQKRHMLAQGALTCNPGEINLWYCLANWCDIVNLFGSLEDFIDYAYDWNKREILKKGKTQENVNWYYHFFTSDEKYNEEKIRYKEALLTQSITRTVNRIYDLARSNTWKYFLTFTFDPTIVNREDYGECAKKLANWLNNIRHCNRDMRYIIVPEPHKKRGWHFHGLFGSHDGLGLEPSGHYAVDGEPIYNCSMYHYGYTTAIKLYDSKTVIGYMCKYLTKNLCEVPKGKKRYWASRNLQMPVVAERMDEGTLEECLLDIASQGKVSYCKTTSTPIGKYGIIETIHTGGNEK